MIWFGICALAFTIVFLGLTIAAFIIEKKEGVWDFDEEDD